MEEPLPATTSNVSVGSHRAKDHAHDILVGVDGEYIDLWMLDLVHAENLTGEGLAYRVNMIEIKDHVPQAVKPRRQTLGLRTGNEVFVAETRQFY